jgi:WD40 repeat protein
MILYFSGLPAKAQYGGGSGEPNEPYLIYTAEQMNTIGANQGHWDKHFKLTADIDLSSYTGTDFNIIGNWSSPFRGVFDGNGHTISNFNYTSTGGEDIGLFAYVGPLFWEISPVSTGEIKDLGLIDPNIAVETGNHVGSLVGQLKSGTISGCYCKEGNVSGIWRVGGLVGYNHHGSIITSYSTGTVEGNGSVGGLVGCNYGDFEDYGYITTSYSTGSVSGSNYVGGLVGENSGSIDASNSAGMVSGEEYVGGLVGNNKYEWSEDSGRIIASYSTGMVSGSGNVGGLVGINERDANIATSYSTGEVTASGWYVGGLVGMNYGNITTSYSTGTVTGDRVVGGLVGLSEVTGIVNGCYSSGSVSGNVQAGGLAGGGLGGWGPITNSFWDIKTSGQVQSAGGEGKTTAEMQMESTFTSAGWDFAGESINGTEDIWSICEGTNYPRLPWHIPAGDFVCPDGITVEDFVFFIEYWGHDDCGPSNEYCHGTDLDFNGTVDAGDFEILLENWLQFQLTLPPQESGPPQEPEPPGQEIRTLLGHTGPVACVAFSPDGKRILTGSWDDTAKLWDAETGQEIRTFSGHTDWVTSVAFSPDGKQVLTGSYDRTAKLWDVETGQEIHTFSGHTSWVTSVAFSPDGMRVLTGSRYSRAKLWDAKTGQEILTFRGSLLPGALSVAFSPDGTQILTGSYDGTAKLWEAETGQEIRPFSGHTNGTLSVAFSPDGMRILTGSADSTAKLWDAETGQEIHTFDGHTREVTSVAFSPDGMRVLTGSGDSTARIWPLLQPEQPQEPEPLPEPEPPSPYPPPPKGRSCFPADTPVLVNGALVQISDVVSGQMAGELHCSPATDCSGQIETVEEHEGTFECRDIVLESGNRISVVDAHCFMLDSGRWIAAQDLRSGLRLKTINGTVGIKSVAKRVSPFVGKVYNLKIKGAEKYFAGKDRLIVRDY